MPRNCAFRRIGAGTAIDDGWSGGCGQIGDAKLSARPRRYARHEARVGRKDKIAR